MMWKTIEIRNTSLPKCPRVFDVTVDENGDVIRYDMQNIRGRIFIEEKEVKRQINEALAENMG